jgi:hypothetical protein
MISVTVETRSDLGRSPATVYEERTPSEVAGTTLLQVTKLQFGWEGRVQQGATIIPHVDGSHSVDLVSSDIPDRIVRFTVRAATASQATVDAVYFSAAELQRLGEKATRTVVCKGTKIENNVDAVTNLLKGVLPSPSEAAKAAGKHSL